MKKSLIWAAALSCTVSSPAAVAACELDGLPGIPGMGAHRFNPFAHALRTLPGSKAPPRTQEIREGQETAKPNGEEAASSAQPSEGSSPRPARKVEGDFSNAPADAKD